jgi:hypothetical protein
MVLPLGQSGHGDAADDSGSLQSDGERASVRGMVGKIEAVFLKQVGVLLLEAEADGVGAAIEAGHGVALAPHPLNIIGGGSGQGRVEERLTEPANINNDGKRLGERDVAQARAEQPGNGGVELLPLQFALLHENLFEILFDGH